MKITCPKEGANIDTRREWQVCIEDITGDNNPVSIWLTHRTTDPERCEQIVASYTFSAQELEDQKATVTINGGVVVSSPSGANYRVALAAVGLNPTQCPGIWCETLDISIQNP
ncbi:hypothetical protein BDV25DRAFT_137127 [Aspergillus avenaceus]|uniref:Uncharacterized protein n=1 Tax=Aspergillus avenaceus TaxID=36643 RepID=A0A5N6U3T7_ASPAV|nr:hypothetical protein BDV25DRAFT_137127 [Aspergillus avenaceus]